MRQNKQTSVYAAVEALCRLVHIFGVITLAIKEANALLFGRYLLSSHALACASGIPHFPATISRNVPTKGWVSAGHPCTHTPSVSPRQICACVTLRSASLE